MLGLTATAMATDAGASVIVSDPVAARRSAALDSGAAEPLIVLEMSGSPAAVRTALRVVGVVGVVVLVGSVSPGGEIGLDPEVLVRNSLTLRGVHNYSGRHLEQAVDYLTSAWHSHPFAGLVGKTLPLERIDEALVLAATGAYPRIALDPHRTG
jgi:threonine dehydrogenase-like Zn-dependent dehydrogenase